MWSSGIEHPDQNGEAANILKAPPPSSGGTYTEWKNWDNRYGVVYELDPQNEAKLKRDDGGKLVSDSSSWTAADRMVRMTNALDCATTIGNEFCKTEAKVPSSRVWGNPTINLVASSSQFGSSSTSRAKTTPSPNPWEWRPVGSDLFGDL